MNSKNEKKEINKIWNERIVRSKRNERHEQHEQHEQYKLDEITISTQY